MATKLHHEIKQPKPFRSAETEAFVNLLRTSSLLIAQLDDELRPADISQPQYNVLRILRGAGEDGLHLGEVGARMVNRDPDVTRLIDRLVARGFVDRERDSTDRRVITARITSDGRAVVDALDDPVRRLHERQLGNLSRAELKAFSALLEKARAPQAAGGEP
jgi:DNA-binding MarR family transcriptional regulator